MPACDGGGSPAVGPRPGEPAGRRTLRSKASDQTSPFGITVDQVVEWATSQFQKRYARIERSRGKTLAELDALAEDDL